MVETSCSFPSRQAMEPLVVYETLAHFDAFHTLARYAEGHCDPLRIAPREAHSLRSVYSVSLYLVMSLEIAKY